MDDSATGIDRAPVRYSSHGRETIDRLRDVLGDEGFVAHCLGCALKYRDREGLKGEASEDRKKAWFYIQMAMFVRGIGPDPREYRPDHAEYQREATAWPAPHWGELLDVGQDVLSDEQEAALAMVEAHTALVLKVAELEAEVARLKGDLSCERECVVSGLKDDS